MQHKQSHNLWTQIVQFFNSMKDRFHEESHPHHLPEDLHGVTIHEIADAFGKYRDTVLSLLTSRKSINDLGIPKEDAIELAHIVKTHFLKGDLTTKHEKGLLYILHLLLNDYNEHVQHKALQVLNELSKVGGLSPEASDKIRQMLRKR